MILNIESLEAKKQIMERGITAYFIPNYCTVTVPTKNGCRVQKYT
jgi:hypothetical protein